jgi:preprotein translocase subunit SecY
VSLIIFAGIVSGLPSGISKLFLSFNPEQIFVYIGLLAVTLITIAGVVMVTEGQRNIPVSYAKRVRGDNTYGGSSSHLPLRVNQAGVIPIIFAMSIMLFPGMIATFLMKASNPMIASAASTMSNLFQNQIFYSSLYFLLIVMFTYFYTAVVFDPVKIAENLQKQGGYIPGIRPGKTTTDFLYKIMNRITLTGSMFLGIIAVLPFIVQGVTNIQSLQIGGTGILIVVSVVIETIKQIEGQLVMRDYEGF